MEFISGTLVRVKKLSEIDEGRYPSFVDKMHVFCGMLAYVAGTPDPAYRPTSPDGDEIFKLDFVDPALNGRFWSFSSAMVDKIKSNEQTFEGMTAQEAAVILEKKAFLFYDHSYNTSAETFCPTCKEYGKRLRAIANSIVESAAPTKVEVPAEETVPFKRTYALVEDDELTGFIELDNEQVRLIERIFRTINADVELSLVESAIKRFNI